jgi:hypothetical protein
VSSMSKGSVTFVGRPMTASPSEGEADGFSIRDCVNR